MIIQVIRYAWGPDYADPMTYLELLYSKSGAINITKYNNPEYDKLIELAQVNNDNAVRMDAMKKAEKIATEEFFYSGLYYESANYAANPKIKNVVIRAVGAPIDFYYADLDK
jgi:oligopeptide transport system substrate-binding protein